MSRALRETAQRAVDSLAALVAEAGTEGGAAQERGDVRARSRAELLSERVQYLSQALQAALKDADVAGGAR